MNLKSICKTCLLQRHVNFLVTRLIRRLLNRLPHSAIVRNIADRCPIAPNTIVSLIIASAFCKFYSRGSIGRELFWTGTYPEKTSLLRYLHIVGHASVVLDVGANVGLFSVCGAIANPQCRIFAFEPVPYLASIRKSNSELNHLKNVTILKKALSSKNCGKIKLYMPDDDTMGSIIPIDAAQAIYEVSSTTLDMFCEINNIINKIDLIKIDVEGAEILVFEGAKSVLQHSMPTILCEVLEHDVAEGLNDIFIKLDYGFYNVTSDGLAQSDLIFASANSDNRNWLLVHKSKSIL